MAKLPDNKQTREENVDGGLAEVEGLAGVQERHLDCPPGRVPGHQISWCDPGRW